MDSEQAITELQRRLDDPDSVLLDGDVDVKVDGDEVNISMHLYFCSKVTVERMVDEFLNARRGLLNEGISP